MNENLKKLILIEFGIVLISFLILSNLNAQGNPSLQPVTSAHDYCNVENSIVENSIDDLAVEPYHIHQISPAFSSANYYYVNGKLVDSSWNRKIGRTRRND